LTILTVNAVRVGYGSEGSGTILFGMRRTYNVTWIISIGIP